MDNGNKNNTENDMDSDILPSDKCVQTEEKVQVVERKKETRGRKRKSEKREPETTNENDKICRSKYDTNECGDDIKSTGKRSKSDESITDSATIEPVTKKKQKIETNENDKNKEDTKYSYKNFKQQERIVEMMIKMKEMVEKFEKIKNKKKDK